MTQQEWEAMGKTGVAPFSAPSTSAITPADLYQDNRTDQEKTLQEQLNAENQASQTPVNEDEIRQKTTSQFQSEIDALNNIYNEQVKRANVAGLGRLGESGAIQARGGLLGSDFGSSQTQNVTNANEQVVGAIDAERNAAISNVQSKIRDSVAQQLSEKKLAKQQGAEALLEYYRNERANKEAKAKEYISSLITNKTPLDQSTADLISKSFGVPIETVFANYKKVAADTEASALEASRAGQFNLNEGEKRYDATGELIAGSDKPIKPETQTGIVGEYEYYKKQEETAGRTPKSFSEYQNEDANRKALASSVANVNGLTTQQSKLLSGITNKYQADSLVQALDKGKGLETIADQVLANPNSATNQLKSLYALVKNLDPDSAVREGEIGLANKANSYFQNLATSFKRLTEGQIIAPETAKEMANATKDLVKAWEAAKNAREARYKAQSDTLGVGKAFGDYLSASSKYLDMPSPQSLTDFLQSKPELKNKAKEILTNDPNLTDEDLMQILSFNQVGGDTDQASSGIKLGSKLAIANNNPGNLRFAGQVGATQGKGGFAMFISPMEGVKALVNQIKLDASKNRTVSQFINKYAPPIENNTSLYLQQFVKALGVSPDEKLKNLDPQEIAKFMAKKESSSIIG